MFLSFNPHDLRVSAIAGVSVVRTIGSGISSSVVTAGGATLAFASSSRLFLRYSGSFAHISGVYLPLRSPSSSAPPRVEWVVLAPPPITEPNIAPLTAASSTPSSSGLSVA